mgnify:CR=1 FL=1
MAVISVRGLDETQLEHLKEQARRQGVSMNKLALQRLIGPESGTIDNQGCYHDLDNLAGTWTEAETSDFLHSIEPLAQVERDLWH